MKRIIFLFTIIFYISGINASAFCKIGFSGNEVVQIQQKLNTLGYRCGYADGIFGKRTEKAVMNFQKDNNLYVDGICGRNTLNAISKSHFSDAELLAMVINGEARGESYEGQVAVGAVVLNRIRHPSFPDTMQDVIYQPGAFSAVKDGQINKSVTDSCKKAAIDALNGSDPSEGAVYYYNPETATCKWIRTRTKIKTIWFYKFINRN